MPFCFGCEWLKRESLEGTCDELLKWLGAEALTEATLSFLQQSAVGDT